MNDILIYKYFYDFFFNPMSNKINYTNRYISTIMIELKYINDEYINN